MKTLHTHSMILIALVGVAIVGVGCRTGRVPDSAASVTGTATLTATVATPIATRSSTPEAEVLAAYSRYWQVYSDAMFQSDTTHLSEVMTGPRLDRALEEIRGLTAKGQAVRVVVQNDPVVGTITAGSAMILDSYKNASYVIDATTKQPVAGTGTPNTLKDAVTLVRIGGSWKVSDAVRQVGSP